jgi:endonuclease/exonuclease/phosphatase family metal-dependent hydrolase
MLAHQRSGQILADLANSCYDGSPQVVMGDFNATQDSILYRTLQEQAAAHETASHDATLHDAWHEAGEQSGPDETYHGGNGEGSFPGRVDHILVPAPCACAALLSRLKTTTQKSMRPITSRCWHKYNGKF